VSAFHPDINDVPGSIHLISWPRYFGAICLPRYFRYGDVFWRL